jgi:hypothetical protein
MGDTIQFVRYLPLVKQSGERIVLECQPALESLLRGMTVIDELVPRGAPLPPFDVHLPLLSLPRVLRAVASGIPAPVAYLAPPADLVRLWGERLGTRQFQFKLCPTATI